MNIIDTLKQALCAPGLGGSEWPMVIGHTGFIFALRREVPTAPERDVRTVFGCPMSESGQVPHGHFYVGGQLHRYTPVTLDERVAAAQAAVAETIRRAARFHEGMIAFEFDMARQRMGVLA